MKALKNILVSLLVLLGIGGGGMVAVDQLGSGYVDNNFTAATHSTVSTAAALPVEVLAENFARRYARIENHSGTTVYLFFTDVTASTTIDDLAEGITLLTTESYEIKPENLYTGYIYASSTAASKALAIVENN